MRTFTNTVVVLVFLVLVLSLFAGCAALGGSCSAGGQMGARMLTATVKGPGSLSLEVDPAANRGVVVVKKHKIVVEGDSVLLDGRQVMTLSPKSKKVDVTCAGGRLTISDGVASTYDGRL